MGNLLRRIMFALGAVIGGLYFAIKYGPDLLAAMFGK
jgi:hypothetical protein